ncbi:hypothetical protein C2845_PM02G12630 [Panicum miliaceum]|uniref:E3 ubiquitin-protein ligase MIEL1-like n=1 Tax=Panicum miliaceum TaxID=4540 RepID=A0A3L6S7D9_PANMI|nr:hypothetical protein C2845_PM02G12630 [Panicum miliaceum]
MDSGTEQHGCEHYRRGCRVVAPCCGEVFGCRHCHNDAKNSLEVDPRDRHEIPRHEIKKVQQNCSNCGACMGKYFCEICKFFDDDALDMEIVVLYFVKKTMLPNLIDILLCSSYQRANTTVMDVAYAGKTGGADNFFHCDKCGCCYSNVLKDSHRCVERAMHHNCPVCFEYLFDSTKDISVLQCGHTIHLECMNEMRAHHHFSCPVCSRSACDMTDTWRKLDEEVAATPMPEIYLTKMVWILCNDCSATSSVRFHVLGQKCPGCSSYNTRETRAR